MILAVMISLVLILWSMEEEETIDPAAATDGSSPAEEEEEENLWYIGVAMSCVACLANAFGYPLRLRGIYRSSTRFILPLFWADF